LLNEHKKIFGDKFNSFVTKDFGSKFSGLF